MRVIDENLFFFSWFGIDDHLMFHGFYWICFSELSMCVCVVFVLRFYLCILMEFSLLI